MKNKNQSYWKSNLKVVFSLLLVWFIASYGFGIIFSNFLDQIKIGGFKLGFWFAQTREYFCICYFDICLCLADEKTRQKIY